MCQKSFKRVELEFSREMRQLSYHLTHQRDKSWKPRCHKPKQSCYHWERGKKPTTDMLIQHCLLTIALLLLCSVSEVLKIWLFHRWKLVLTFSTFGTVPNFFPVAYPMTLYKYNKATVGHHNMIILCYIFAMWLHRTSRHRGRSEIVMWMANWLNW